MVPIPLSFKPVPNAVKYLFLLLCLLPAVTFHARDTSWNVGETACDTSYEFSLRYRELTEESMNEIICTATPCDDGVTPSMHTDRREFAVAYTGADKTAIEPAKSIATDLSTQARNRPDRR